MRHISRAGISTGEKKMIPDLRTVLDTAFTERWQKFVRESERARSDPTEKAIHDLRVAMRRLMALLNMATTALPKCGGSQVRRQFKKHLKSLSDLRDIQVQILEVRQLQTEHKELSTFLDELLVREAAQTKRARKEIQHIDTVSMKDHVVKLQARFDDLLFAPAMNDTSRSIFLGILAQTYVRAAAVKKDIAGAADISDGLHKLCEKIHRLRLIFKRFRYTVEILEPVLPRVSGRMLKRMSNYQSKMGTIQDTEVLMASISSQAKRVRKKEFKTGTTQSDPLAPVIALLNSRLKQESDEFLLEVDELDKYWNRII